MRKIRLFDKLFAHAQYSTDYQICKYFNWSRNSIDRELAFYTDHSLMEVNSDIKYNIAWLLESPLVTPSAYKWLSEPKNYTKFNQVITCDERLLKLDSRFSFCPVGGCWIPKNQQKIYLKGKNLSMIASNKQQTVGQILRHQVVNKYKSQIDLYGRTYNPIPHKIEALRDYRFSITIENAQQNYYFTEKLIDCFRTGTIPIYWGCPDIGEIFDTEGMIIFNNLDELTDILPQLTPEFYESKLEAIQTNFEKANNYLMAENYIWENIIQGNELY